MKCFSFLLPFILIGAISAQTPKADTIHSPKKATFLSLAIPSAGQFYNQIKKDKKKKNNLWWKLPIIYGGLGTSIYFLIDNQNEFNLIKAERINRNSTGLINLYPQYSSAQLEIIQDDYRRWRDLSVISVLGVYLLQVLDANIEGHLLHFDNSDQLSIGLTSNFSFLNPNPPLLCIHLNF